ncbi:HEAT repeat domain-containing protein [Pendulispora albinea]|uniref:HEAT repeat domain-containing protein n=1 Tax=Pendulispora albinea TaxID=2741071 RepID=A0ABZ2M3Z1_9BACT
MRVLWLGLAFGLLTNCARAGVRESSPASMGDSVSFPPSSIDAPSPTPYPNDFRPTEKLVSKRRAREEVDRMAAFGRITSEAIGPDGGRSPVWTAYERAVAETSPAEQIALARHENPVVRGYFVQLAAVEIPSSMERVYPLLADATPVATQSGCVIRHTSIALLAFDALLPERGDPARSPFLARVASDDKVTFGVRAQALTALATAGHPDANRLARAALASSNEELRGAGIRALGTRPEGGDLERLEGFARSPDAKTRQAAAMGLGSIETRRASELLVPLFTDPDPMVQRAARRAYAANVASDPDKLRLYLQADAETADDMVFGLSRRETELAFDVVESALMENKPRIGLWEVLPFVRGLVKSVGPDAIPRLRKLLGARNENAREAAMYWLSDIGDKGSIPDLRGVLRGGTVHDVEQACHALVKLRAVEAVPDLVELLKHDDPDVRLHVAKALVAFRARSAISALEATVARERGWAKVPLTKALDALKKGEDLKDP